MNESFQMNSNAKMQTHIVLYLFVQKNQRIEIAHDLVRFREICVKIIKLIMFYHKKQHFPVEFDNIRNPLLDLFYISNRFRRISHFYSFQNIICA